ncbi:hypothetical protein [Helicobacter pylori]|uniref:hypothetical protein n=1 Tax=Helicobacter pylori TaxID=210 RepID=UPI0030BECC8D
MMRIVIFDANGSLEAFDYRGVLIHKQEVQANEKVKLPFSLFAFSRTYLKRTRYYTYIQR